MMIRAMRRAWAGRARLWPLYGLGLLALAMIQAGVLLAQRQWEGLLSFAPSLYPLWALAAFGLLLPGKIWWAVSVWRCAGREPGRVGAILARFSLPFAMFADLSLWRPMMASAFRALSGMSP